MTSGFHPDEPPEDWMQPPTGPLRARGQRHRDAPVSGRERIVWWVIWGALAALAAAMLTYMLTR